VEEFLIKIIKMVGYLKEIYKIKPSNNSQRFKQELKLITIIAQLGNQQEPTSTK